ncbi:MAG: inositol-3-phosphate synthase [Tepidisphaeraceae bacterium]
MSSVRVAIAGVGNCASSLVQGICYYAARSGADAELGLSYPRIGSLRVSDIKVVAAFDIDARKVGRPLEQAIFASPNNTKVFCDVIRASGVVVQMGDVLDGIAPHMADYPPSQRFEVSDAKAVDVAKTLRDTGAEILINYLPVGSQKATEHYATACLDTGVSLVNCIPVFIASDPAWAKKFADRGIPLVGDDIKAQVGATITHRTLARLFDERGVRIDSTYQLNTGGNTDFLNMLSRERLRDKKTSKTDAVQSQLDVPLDPDKIHIGPSDFVPFMKDNKVCFLRIEGTGFGGVPLNLELRLSVEDSPNSAGSAIDAIRCCKLARDAKIAGPIEAVSAWTMKHPPRQMPDRDARMAVDEFITHALALGRARSSA